MCYWTNNLNYPTTIWLFVWLYYPINLKRKFSLLYFRRNSFTALVLACDLKISVLSGTLSFSKECGDCYFFCGELRGGNNFKKEQFINTRIISEYESHGTFQSKVGKKSNYRICSLDLSSMKEFSTAVKKIITIGLTGFKKAYEWIKNYIWLLWTKKLSFFPSLSDSLGFITSCA